MPCNTATSGRAGCCARPAGRRTTDAVTARLPTRTLVDLVAGLAAADPDRPALVVGETTTTYGELEDAARRAAANLAAAGVGPGTRLALVDDATVGSVAALLGASRVGVACALMNPR